MHYSNASQAMPDFSQAEFYTTTKFLSGKSLDLSSTYIMTMTALILGMACEFVRGEAQDDSSQPPTLSQLRYKLTSGNDRRLFTGSAALDLLDARMVTLTKSKIHTRRALDAAGVTTALGGLAWAANQSVLAQIAAAGIKNVLVKPNKGSAARGVIPNITIDRARQHIQQNPDDAFIVEQFIQGTEYRLHVVGGELDEYFAKLDDDVVGDGKSTLRTLLQKKFSKQIANPYCSAIKAWYPEKEKFLIGAGYDLKAILPPRARICLNNRQRPSGRDGPYAFTGLEDNFKDLARRVAKTVGADSGAIDLIYNKDAGPYVLEFNAKPGIVAPCFPFNAPWNLRNPEALLRNSFPVHSDHIRRIKRYNFLGLLHEFANKPEITSIDAMDFVEFA